jgi:hypothetical protein
MFPDLIAEAELADIILSPALHAAVGKHRARVSAANADRSHVPPIPESTAQIHAGELVSHLSQPVVVVVVVVCVCVRLMRMRKPYA